MLYDLFELYEEDKDIINKLISLIVEKKEYKHYISTIIFEIDNIKNFNKWDNMKSGQRRKEIFKNKINKVYNNFLNSYLFNIINEFNKLVDNNNVIDLIFLFLVYNDDVKQIMKTNILKYKLINNIEVNKINDDKFSTILIGRLFYKLIDFIKNNQQDIYCSEYKDLLYTYIDKYEIDNLFDYLEINNNIEEAIKESENVSNFLLSIIKK